MKMKKCICCGEMKPLSEYYRCKRMHDGHLNKCMECCRKYEREKYKSKK